MQDSQWVFSDAQAMPNNVEVVTTNDIDWTASKFKDWINSPIPIWFVFTCNDVPDAGTSIQVEFYQHTARAITDGDLLWAGPVVTLANLSADPFNDGHWLAVVPLITLMTAAMIMGGQDRYMGPVLKAVGDMSTGKVDGWIHMGANPPVYVAPPAIVGASNVVMPT
ncbi:MAG: hypothetical protein EHM35_11970 [Planctomycetaceae bacterium]|nr:MAG: hypothetical protein EHM35_11970 [Planctomycetaceae bacterium]